MGRYNVNAARAQRLEALGERWEFEVDGELFWLPVELPRQVVSDLAALDPSDMDGLLTLLLGADQLKRLDELTLSVQDVQALLEAYGRDTGMTLGESSASASSGTSTARPSKPTCSGTTGWTCWTTTAAGCRHAACGC